MGVLLAVVLAIIGIIVFRSIKKNGLIAKQKKHRTFIAIICIVLAFISLCVGISSCSSSQAAANHAPDAASAPAASEEKATPAPSQGETKASSTVSGTMKVHYIDVGQGDSEFLELPDGKTMLIDAGPTEAGTTVVNYIKSLGYTKIDYLIASHPHEDHIGGMVAVLNAFTIGEVWAPSITTTTKTYESFIDTVAAKGLTITRAVAGKVVYDDQAVGCEADLLSPGDSASYTDLNDWSAIEEVKFGQEDFLFPGDAPASIITSVCKDKINVLKVAHHGSETGTTAALVKQLSPTYAVISCGVGNTYGHPHASALAAFKSVSLFRTDVQQTITATSDGKSVSFDKAPTSDFTAGTKASGSDSSASTVSSSAATATPTASSGSSAVDKSSITVYVTKTGKKYHSEGCSYLSKSCIPMTLDKAESDGYTPCSKCNPPV